MDARYDVFLSYSRSDDSIMRQIRDFLLQDEISVWTDEHLKIGTEQWQKEIENAIQNSSCLVVLLSPSAKASEWVGREISYAEEINKQIIPVLIKGDAKTAVPLALISHQRLAFESRNFGPAIEKLTTSISGVSGRETPSLKRRREVIEEIEVKARELVKKQHELDEQEKRIKAEAERRAKEILQEERKKSAQRTQRVRRLTTPVLKFLRLVIRIPFSPFVFYASPENSHEEDRVVAILSLVLLFGALSFLYFGDWQLVNDGRRVRDVLGFSPGGTEVIFVFIVIPLLVLVWYLYSTVYSLAITVETKEAVTASQAVAFGCAIGTGVAYAVQQFSLSFLSKAASGFILGVIIFLATYILSYYFAFMYVVSIKKNSEYHPRVRVRSLLNVLILLGLIVLAAWLFGLDGWIRIVNV